MAKNRVLICIAAFLICSIAYAIVDHDPWDGTKWDGTAPDIDQPIGDHYKEMQDLRLGIGIRMDKEHQDMATSSVGGWHTWGSAVCYEGTSDPCNRPDNSTALDSAVVENHQIDFGRLWIDDNYDPPVLRRWNGTNFTEMVAAHLHHATALELVLESAENANTDGSMDSKISAVGYKDAAGDCDLGYILFSHDGTSDDQKGAIDFYVNDGDDDNAPSKHVLELGSDQLATFSGAVTIAGAFTGGASSDIAINTNKFTVAASTGNTLVAGTFISTGVATIADASKTASNAAPTDPCDIANMKYVDDQISAIQDPSYSGGESHTFDGGLIMKQGTKAVTGTSEAVSFAVAFPTACTNVVTSGNDAASTLQVAIQAVSLSTTGFTLHFDTNQNSVHWIAIGY